VKSGDSFRLGQHQTFCGSLRHGSSEPVPCGLDGGESHIAIAQFLHRDFQPVGQIQKYLPLCLAELGVQHFVRP
jgi:hypothetical protein